MRAWLLYNGRYYSDGGCADKAFKTKKAAIKWIRAQGFKYNKSEDLYLNNNIEEWYRIKEMEFINE